jgi:hypothetical protein
MAAKKRNRKQDKKKIVNRAFHNEPPVLIVNPLFVISELRLKIRYLLKHTADMQKISYYPTAVKPRAI